MAGRKPDYIIKAATPDSKIWTRVGAAWVNDSGTVSIDLDPFVVLSGRDSPSLVMHPNTDRKRGEEG